MRSLFIVGSQGIPADYGGFETFADETATRLAARGHSVYVTCERTGDEPKGPSAHEGVNLLYVHAPDNNLRTIVADVKALWRCYKIAEPGDVVYLLGYGVGPFAWPVLQLLRAKGVRFWLNPDGLEWKRPRWPTWARNYLQVSEWFLLRQADRVICDAEAIKEHHRREWNVDSDRADVIEYGAPVVDRADLSDNLLARRNKYLAQHDLQPSDYFTYVGRFVPDNNLELMVRGVLDNRVERRLLVIAPQSQEDHFYQKVHNLVASSSNPSKVIFAGTVYDQPLLQTLRLGGYAYLHGHEMGGTNPSLVEAMGTGSLALALNTEFNREVLGDAGLFWGKSVESFVQTVIQAEQLTDNEVRQYRERAVDRVRSHYNWERIAGEYERLVWGNRTLELS